MTQNNEDALIEFKDAVKQLCNDFSSLQGNVYIKDVEASLDALCEQYIESPISKNEQQEALLDKLLAEYWDIAYSEGNSGLWHGKKAQSTLNDIRELFKTQPTISQNEQQEVIGFIDEADEGIFGDVQKGIAEGLCKVGDLLYTSPPKQIPDGWKPIETAPKGESVLVAGGDCNYPCVANWSGHHEDVWCVDGQMDSYAEIGWPTHWIPLDSLPELPTAPTNTEVGE